MLRGTIRFLLVGCLLLQVGCAGRVQTTETPVPDQLHPGDWVRVTLRDGTRVEGNVIEVTEDSFAIKTLYKQHDTRGTRARSAEYKWEDVAHLKLRGTEKEGESLKSALVMSVAVVGLGFVLLIAVTEGLSK